MFIDCSVIYSTSINRHPGIYKADYLCELYSRSGDDPNDAPPAPELPDWCHGMFCVSLMSEGQMSVKVHARKSNMIFKKKKNVCLMIFNMREKM